MKVIAVCILLLSLSVNCFAAHRHVESYYEKIWCKDQNGTAEVLFNDGTRADCVIRTHAIEFEFALKWAESIGQSLHYGALTGKTPGIVLILEKPTDMRFLNRLHDTIKYYKLPITVWELDAWKMN